MKDKIKEILESFASTDENIMFGDIVELNSKQSHLLLDYITNLQQENERLKELCDEYEEEHSNEFKIWKEERHELLDYKSRCEKAIEYINTHYLNANEPELLNILQNGSDSQ